jgi:hypothetical protein
MSWNPTGEKISFLYTEQVDAKLIRSYISKNIATFLRNKVNGTDLMTRVSFII